MENWTVMNQYTWHLTSDSFIINCKVRIFIMISTSLESEHEKQAMTMPDPGFLRRFNVHE